MHQIKVETLSKGLHSEINLNMGATQEISLFSGSSNSPPKVPRRPVIYNWSDLLLRQPRCYVRFVLAIYFSLGNGRLPQNTDFPDFLQLRGQETQFHMFRILTNETDATEEYKLGDIASKTLGWKQRPEVEDTNRPEKGRPLNSPRCCSQGSSNGDSAHLPHMTDEQEIDHLTCSEQLLDYAVPNSRMLGTANTPSGNSSHWTDAMLLLDFPAFGFPCALDPIDDEIPLRV
jgi:hypothetical protein